MARDCLLDRHDGLDVADELDGEMILVAVVVKVFLDPVITIEQLVAGHG